MRTIPNDKHSVRRRLFFGPDSCESNNAKDQLKEIYDSDADRTRKKWNFDIKNDLPLEGPITWGKARDGQFDWIGTVKEPERDQNDVPEVNTTPRRVRAVNAPPVRKRRVSEEHVNMERVESVKRRLSCL